MFILKRKDPCLQRCFHRQPYMLPPVARLKRIMGVKVKSCCLVGAVSTYGKTSKKGSILATLPPAVQQHLESALDWTFDVMKLEEMTGKRWITNVHPTVYNTDAVATMQKHHAIAKFCTIMYCFCSAVY